MFNFGKNWQAYAANALTEEKLTQAKQDMVTLLQRPHLKGYSFMDIGCGSGVHTVAAVQLGASPVYALDIDPESVKTTQQVIRRFLGHTEAIFLRQASILNPEDMAVFPTVDIVYSWGVLHHTGNMYEAIRAAAAYVNPEGLYVIAIYNRHITSPIWRLIKYSYNRLPPIGRRLMYALFYGVIFLAKFAVTRQNPLAKERGMDFGYDVVDWLGGYPYEYASAEEIIRFVSSLGFQLVHFIPAKVGTGCNEFVFRRV